MTRSISAQSAFDLLATLLPPAPSARSGIKVRVEHLSAAQLKAGAAPSCMSASADARNIARTARFSIVDGAILPYSGGTAALTDGRLASGDDEPAANFFFAPGPLEGRIRLDFAAPIPIERVITCSRHKSDRAPQVYKLYGSNGDSPRFESAPKIGTDPARRGWTLIAAVDTRPRSGPVGGQYAAEISAGGGLLGTYKHLLLCTFVTETNDNWGHTFFSELQVIRQPEARP